MKLKEFGHALARDLWRAAQVDRQIKDYDLARIALLHLFPPFQDDIKNLKKVSLEQFELEVYRFEMTWRVRVEQDDNGEYCIATVSAPPGILRIKYIDLKSFALLKKRKSFLREPVESLLLEVDLMYSDTYLIGQFEKLLKEHRDQYQKDIDAYKSPYEKYEIDLEYWKRVKVHARHGIILANDDFDLFEVFVRTKNLEETLVAAVEIVDNDSDTGLEKKVIRRIVAIYNFLMGLSAPLRDNRKNIKLIIKEIA